MLIDENGRIYFVYVLHTEDREIVGADPRPIGEIEKDWLAKQKVTAQRAAHRERAYTAAAIRNNKLIARQERLGEREGEDPIVRASEEVEEASRERPVSLDDVAPPPTEAIDEDEVLRLGGVEIEAAKGIKVTSSAVHVAAIDVFAIQQASGDVLKEFLSSFGAAYEIAPLPSKEGEDEGRRPRRRRRST